MAYQGAKGWYIQKLREKGITKHPVELRKLELYKTFVVKKLYDASVEKQAAE
ncbi:DUF2639 domain-containing protein [Cytobacillus oceanisediminis]|uniref:DUF2639 domain-containing protein n=1 Tax=Cytobacillus oceanisediminis TaxID=665099 RepID=UPI0011A302C0